MKSKSVSNNKPAFNIALAYQGFLDEPVPTEIFDAIVSGKVGLFFKVLKTGLVLLVGALIAVIALNILAKDTDKQIASLSVQQLAVSSHSAIAMDNVYPVHVGVEDLEVLNDWLSYRMGKNLEVQSLDEAGYTLLGANIIPDSNRVSASVVYESQDGSKVSLFIRNEVGAGVDGESEGGRQSGTNWLSWQDKGRQMVLVGNLDQAELETVFDNLN